MTATITASQAAAGTRGALMVGPDMDRLRRSCPSRSAASSWPWTERRQHGGAEVPLIRIMYGAGAGSMTPMITGGR